MNRRSFLGGSGLGAAGIALGASPARLLAFSGADDAAGTPGGVVQTSAGKIRGMAKGGVTAYKGIRYGASTAGTRRFMPPAKPEPWTGVQDAFELGERSPQIDGGLVPEWGALDRYETMGEDCLRLNVWTPSPGTHKRPVMVWLHGGGYAGGSDGWTVYDGTNLAHNHDVVIVGVNHRLNVFGYLYLAELGGPKYADSSNVGMMDIVAAFEWVRDNIAAFGGDPANVTIFGQSGGGGKVSTLLAMPPAKGLFHRAIAESGTSIRGISKADATKSTTAFMAKLGLKPDQVDELQKLPVEKLLSGMGGRGGGPGLRIGPVIDGKTLPANPFDPVASPLCADIPLLMGSNETEVTFTANRSYDPPNDAALKERVKTMLKTDDAHADQVLALYRKNRPKATNMDLALIIETDVSNFRTGVDTEALRKSAQKAPVYMYRFAWYSPVRGGVLRAMHTMEIAFVYDNLDIAKGLVGDGQEKYKLSATMSEAWTNFARTGDPNFPGLPHWAPFNATTRATMVFNNKVEAVNDPYGEERRLVEGLTKNDA